MVYDPIVMTRVVRSAERSASGERLAEAGLLIIGFPWVLTE